VPEAHGRARHWPLDLGRDAFGLLKFAFRAADESPRALSGLKVWPACRPTSTAWSHLARVPREIQRALFVRRKATVADALRPVVHAVPDYDVK